MKILKVAVGNSTEAFIEDNFSDGLNIISSDDNNKGTSFFKSHDIMWRVKMYGLQFNEYFF